LKLPTKKSEIETDLRKFKFLIYGVPKCGKSTFASNFPNALFICTEPGHKFLKVFGGDHVHATWNDIKETVRNLIKEDHDFETVVLDTVDNAWDMCSKHVCKAENISHESDADYGKGWSAVTKEFKLVFNELANRNYGLIFISHEKTMEKETKGLKRSFTDTTLGSAARKYIHGLCDFIFYGYIDDDGKRWLRTKSNDNFNAGDRAGTLPEILPMDFNNFKTELTKGLKNVKSK